MSKISKEEKKKYQIVSKILWVLTRIGNICCWIGVGAVALATLATAIIAPNFKVNADTKEVTLFDNTASYTIRDKDVVFGEEDKDYVTIKDNVLTVKNEGTEVISMKISNETIDEVEKFIEEKAPNVAVALPFALAGVTALLIYTALILGHGAVIFKNIATKKTPFVKDNITRSEKAFKYMIFTLILAFVVDLIMTLASGLNASMSFEVTSISGILGTYVMIYIFKAGYQLEEAKEKAEDKE